MDKREQQQATDVSYSWEVNGVAVANSGSTIDTFTPGPGQSISVSVTAASPCGSLITTRTLYAASSIDGQPCEAYRTMPAPEAVYPNPADDKLYVQQGGGEVTLYNLQGQPVSSRTAKPGLVHLNTKHLPTGLYILHYANAAGQTVRQQVRVEH